MSNTKFTEGKWTIFGDWGICKNGWGSELIATFEPRGVSGGEGFANAHLIAAAPEMYKFLDDLANGRGTDYPIEQLLAKARGE